MKHVLAILVQNQPGVLVRVASMFARRGFNIESLAVGMTQVPEYSRITAVTHGSQWIVGQMVKQLEKLIEVEAVQVLTAGESAVQGMAMAKVDISSAREEVMQVAAAFAAVVICEEAATLTMVITGDDDRIRAFTEKLKIYGILEMTRTGLIGLANGKNTIYTHQGGDIHEQDVL